MLQSMIFPLYLLLPLTDDHFIFGDFNFNKKNLPNEQLWDDFYVWKKLEEWYPYNLTSYLLPYFNWWLKSLHLSEGREMNVEQ